MEFFKQHKVSIIGAVIGILAGFSLGAYWYNVSPKRAEAPEKTTNTETISNTDGKVTLSAVDESAMIAISDQQAGDVVLVNAVALGSQGWVAIREGNAGQLGNILGARRIDAGAWSTIAVELLRGTEVGKAYFAVLYKDNGDGEFDHKTDSLIEVAGKTYMQPFMAQ